MAGAQTTVTLVEAQKEKDRPKNVVLLEEEIDPIKKKAPGMSKKKKKPLTNIQRQIRQLKKVKRQQKQIKKLKGLRRAREKEFLRQRQRVAKITSGSPIEDFIGKPVKIPRSKFAIGLDGKRAVKKRPIRFKSDVINKDIASGNQSGINGLFIGENFFGGEQVFISEENQEQFFPRKLKDL